ncbi:MAG: leucyl aminopeptidase [Ignavibacteriae bacterium]|nr:leucyl aminopeptidase [Ignavibacteriota bacterium]
MITLRSAVVSAAKTQSDVVCIFVFEDEKIFKVQTRKLSEIFPSLGVALKSDTFTGKFQETQTLFPSEMKAKLILVGLGKSESVTLERLRRVAATAAKTANSLKAKSLALFEPSPTNLQAEIKGSAEQIAAALAEGAALASYKYRKYLTTEKTTNATLRVVTLCTEDATRKKSVASGVAYAQVVTAATCFARDLANAPPNEIYPETLARQAHSVGRKNRFSVRVFDEKKIARLKMGGVLAVAQGSDRPPRFIIMEYKRGKQSSPTIVLVGKGVTFDAGGISIKPAAGMSEMKMDMSGAAAVIATMQAVAALKLPVNLIGLVPAVENLLGGRAMKPGDIVTHLNGKTSEVDNTDAEGRLILADALAYASRWKPDVVIDLATLTGAVVVGLGHHATGMMGNAQAVMDQLRESGERTFERVWQLPMFEEYEKQNKSDVADVKNSGGRWAGAITAALFLKQFIGKYNWVHLDIAGTAIMSEALDYVPRGASGVGVRLLVDFLQRWRGSR